MQIKIKNKMNCGVDYVCGEKVYRLDANSCIDVEESIKQNEVFSMHVASGAVEIIGASNQAPQTSTETDEYRKKLLELCKINNIKVNQNTGIAKLEAKLTENNIEFKNE